MRSNSRIFSQYEILKKKKNPILVSPGVESCSSILQQHRDNHVDNPETECDREIVPIGEEWRLLAIPKVLLETVTVVLPEIQTRGGIHVGGDEGVQSPYSHFFSPTALTGTREGGIYCAAEGKPTGSLASVISDRSGLQFYFFIC